MRRWGPGGLGLRSLADTPAGQVLQVRQLPQLVTNGQVCVPSFPVPVEPHEPRALLEIGINPAENLAKKWTELPSCQLNGALKESLGDVAVVIIRNLTGFCFWL